MSPGRPPVGRKRLPDAERHERVWALVAEIEGSPVPPRRSRGPHPLGLWPRAAARLVLIGAHDAAEDELGVRIDTESETLATSELLLADLGLRPGQLPLQPWVQGRLR